MEWMGSITYRSSTLPTLIPVNPALVGSLTSALSCATYATSYHNRHCILQFFVRSVGKDHLGALKNHTNMPATLSIPPNRLVAIIGKTQPVSTSRIWRLEGSHFTYIYIYIYETTWPHWHSTKTKNIHTGPHRPISFRFWDHICVHTWITDNIQPPSSTNIELLDCPLAF